MPDYKAILSGQSWNSRPNLAGNKKPVFLTYSFGPSRPLFSSGSDWSTFKEADRQLARKALKLWGDASGIRFIEVKGHEAELKFQWEYSWSSTLVAWADFPDLYQGDFDLRQNRSRDIFGGNVHLNTQSRSELSQNSTYELFVLLHEIGHALGLKHPFHKMEHNKQLLGTDLDNVAHTVMSYTGASETMQTAQLGPLDIQAIRSLYGSPSQDGKQVAKWSWSSAKQTLTQNGKSKADEIFGVAVKDIIKGGSGNDKIYSFDGADTLHGNNGNDILSGGDGNDALFGDSGHDTLGGGGGHDNLQGGTGRDVLSGGYGDDTLYGDLDNDVLKGGDDNDILQGGLGNDDLDGGDGSDTLYGDGDNDVLRGGDGQDGLQGGLGSDALDGGSGDDALQGGEGSDILTGGDGSDRFVFDTPFNGIDEIDQIVDFESWDDDVIVLSSAVFTTLVNGLLSQSAFVKGVAAKDGDDRIIFNDDDPSLSYDQDGSGPSAAILFAKFAGTVTLNAYDFIVV